VLRGRRLDAVHFDCHVVRSTKTNTMNVVIGARPPRKYADPCPTWFTGGPHTWPGTYDPDDRCLGCGITLREHRQRAAMRRRLEAETVEELNRITRARFVRQQAPKLRLVK
jgi:hypothetical protein